MNDPLKSKLDALYGSLEPLPSDPTGSGIDVPGGPYSSKAVKRMMDRHERNARKYAEEMEHLAAGGADYNGLGGWRGAMRRVGRR